MQLNEGQKTKHRNWTEFDTEEPILVFVTYFYNLGWELLLRHESHEVRRLHLGLHPEDPVHHPGL